MLRRSAVAGCQLWSTALKSASFLCPSAFLDGHKEASWLPVNCQLLTSAPHYHFVGHQDISGSERQLSLRDQTVSPNCICCSLSLSVTLFGDRAFKVMIKLT